MTELYFFKGVLFALPPEVHIYKRKRKRLTREAQSSAREVPAVGPHPAPAGTAGFQGPRQVTFPLLGAMGPLLVWGLAEAETEPMPRVGRILSLHPRKTCSWRKSQGPEANRQ